MANSTAVGNKEILIVANTIAAEKDIPSESIIEAMEEGIRIASKKKYGHNLAIECKIDRKTGQINLFNRLEVVDEETANDALFDGRTQISIADAKKIDPEVEIGGSIKTELPPIDLNRVIAQIAKNEIIRKVREAEKDKEYNRFINRVGEIINGAVKKVGIKNVVVDIEGFEAILHQADMIPGERYNVGNRVRAYISEVRREVKGAQIFLSRTHPQFLAKLFAQEVPEIYDDVIEIKAIARDPGSRAKIAVYSREESIDVVGACIGVRGSRVQAVTAELKGEKIDIIKWSPNIAEFVVAALTPAKASKVVVDENSDLVEVVVGEDQLSLAIGRGGQNVRLASQLVGRKIDIMTEAAESAKRTEEFNKASELFMEALDVEDVIARLLAIEGFFKVEDLAEADIDEIKAIEGFDEELAQEIKNRAIEYIGGNSETEEEDTETEEEDESNED